MNAKKGLIHCYYGFGKGKTTAALGLALRASGYDKQVVIVQFLKNRTSGEIKQLEALPNITVLRGQANNAFAWAMTKDAAIETKRMHDENLKMAIEMVKAGKCKLLILDEALDAYQMGWLDETMFKDIIYNKPEELELVITGHSPEKWLCEEANYVSEMVKKKHPYDNGVQARVGIEF